MEESTIKCCICGKVFAGWGNNPCGALDQDCKEIEWGAEDECCDECNTRYVVPGRIARLYKSAPHLIKRNMPDNLVPAK